MTLRRPMPEVLSLADPWLRRCARLAVAGWLGLSAASGGREAAPSEDRVREAMRRATAFMVDTVAYEGGYVWTYLPDLSRRWGELEARPTMIWIEGPGTPAMGDVLLDAFAATGEEPYRQAAMRAGQALIRAQLPAGGWNYVADFAGEASLREWYATVGRHAWRLEEFHVYQGNATFDDATTASASKFLLRLYREGQDDSVRPALDRAIDFVLTSQHASGAWPQRFSPSQEPWPEQRPDYTQYLTFNDEVVAENIDFLLQCHEQLGAAHFRAAAERGMHAYRTLQLPSPQAGWALQYTADLQPAPARTYEPVALATQLTGQNIRHLLRFYSLTGDSIFLERVPEALAWLEATRLPPEQAAGAGYTHPTFIEIGTNRPLYVHRIGSNVVNGRYYVDHDPRGTLGHYSSFRRIPLDALSRRYHDARAGHTSSEPSRRARAPVTIEQVQAVLEAQQPNGAWLVPLTYTSHRWGERAGADAAGDYHATLAGDVTDTSPFRDSHPVAGISTAAYIDRMRVLLDYLESRR
jgi:PelA/Pel-15E family pectate lyase